MNYRSFECSSVKFGAVQYSVFYCRPVHCIAAQCSAVQFSVVQWCTVLGPNRDPCHIGSEAVDTVQYSTKTYRTVQQERGEFHEIFYQGAPWQFY